MKSYDEIAENVLARKAEYEKEKRKKKKVLFRTATALSCCVVLVVLSIAVLKGGFSDMFYSLTPALEGNSTTEDMQTGETEQTTLNEQTSAENLEPTHCDENNPAVNGEDSGNITTGGWFIPALPFDKSFDLTGEVITDSEAQAYFNENRNSIISSLASSGVSTDSVKFSDSGYCHITYNGVEGKCFEIRQNYRDYLLYSGEKLIAVITLWKENGEIYNTASFGANWFENYNAYLNQHKGQELVFVYAGWMEIIIAPDNTYFNPLGSDVSAYLEGVEKPYEIFYNENAVYVP